jgi:hypothetical protein
MRSRTALDTLKWVVCLALFVPARAASAHPGSGIIVDSRRHVYFVHTGVGVLKVDPEGRLLRQEGPGFHFMAIDPDGRFQGQRWPRFPDGEIRVVGRNPSLLLASSFPLTIGPDGALYYPEAKGDGHVHMMRLTPMGRPTTFAILPVATEIGPDGKPVRARWIHGLAAAPDGTLYYAEQHAVRRIGKDGSVSLVAGDITVPGCVRPPAASDERHGPVLRGLDVAADGSLYVAASGCSAVLKITPAGAVSVVLRASDAWSPTGIVVVRDDLYVLEFRHIETERAQEWLPRVRKLSRDGRVTILATVTEPPR